MVCHSRGHVLSFINYWLNDDNGYRPYALVSVQVITESITLCEIAPHHLILYLGACHLFSIAVLGFTRLSVPLF